MSTIEITELEPATVFANSDLALIRKSGENKDRKITQANFIKSIGNPAVKGFTATSDEANKVTLNPSNGTIIDTYYDGMEISFMSPINSNGIVQIRIGALGYKNLQVINTNVSVQLTNTSYIQGIYNLAQDMFYQTNPATVQIYTNDYLAAGQVAGDNSSTTYTLTSAIGVPAQSYYNGMSILFTADIASKGAVLVNVDGLGNKTLTDKEGDKIANDLVENQVILAIYNGNSFIKNLFSEEVPEAPEIPADAYDQDGEVIPENVPPVNKLSVTVGTAGNDYPNITAAIADLIYNFGEDGGNRLCEIILSNTFVWDESIVVDRKNLSWITIVGNNNIVRKKPDQVLPHVAITVQENSVGPNIKGTFKYEIAPSTPTSYFSVCRGKISVIDSIMNIQGGFNPVNHVWFTGGDVNNLCKLNITNSSITGGYPIRFGNCFVNFSNVTLASNHNVLIGGTFNGNITNLNIVQNPVEGDVNTKRIIDIQNCNNLIMNNCSITNTTNSQTANFNNCKGVVLNNCNIKGNGQGLLAQAGSEINVNGGDYRTPTNAVSTSNIIATGQGSLIRLSNNPQGGSSEVSGGVISIVLE